MTPIETLPLLAMLYAVCGTIALGALYFCIVMTRSFWDYMKEWNKEEKCSQVKK